jgi:hypothetical protein
MQFSESWLRTLVNPPISTDELSHRLTMAGLEVEDTVTVAPAFSGVVVALIQSAEPHPNADKLRVCMVDVGNGNLTQHKDLPAKFSFPVLTGLLAGTLAQSPAEQRHRQQTDQHQG